jgi:hypothetical protein
MPLRCPFRVQITSYLLITNHILLLFYDFATLKGDGSKYDLWGDEEEEDDKGSVRVFRQKFTLKDAIGSHACSLEALACM